MITVKAIRRGKHFEDALRLTFRYNPALVDAVKELGERRWVPDAKEWEIPRYELVNLVKKVGRTNFLMEEEVAEAIDRELALEVRSMTREAVESSTEPIIPFDFKTIPFQHQISGFNFGLTNRCFLLADEQGLGKTKQAIDVAVARKADGIRKVLIICGVNSVKYNWQREVHIHSDEKAVVFDGAAAKRIEKVERWLNDGEGYFGIINIEAIRSGSRENRILELLQTGTLNGTIGMVIIDEIHKAKNWKSQQGKAIHLLQAPSRIGLTGTPLMSRVTDLWNLLKWLGAEPRNFWQFRNRYVDFDEWGNEGGRKNEEELHERLAKVMLRRKKEDCLDLPPKLHQTEFIELSEKHKQTYRQILNGIVADLPRILTLSNPLVELLRLRQCTSGLIGEENPKLERLLEMMEEIAESGKKALVFTQWAEVAALVKAGLKDYNPAYITGEVKPEKRDEEIFRFQNDPNCKVIIGTIGAMGTGLTLTAGSYVFFLDKAWTPADNEQAEDRAHRIGTTDTVNVVNMVAKNTIDERIEEVLAEKKETFDAIVEGKFVGKEDAAGLIMRLLEISD